MINCNYLGLNEFVLFGSIIEDRDEPFKTILRNVHPRVINLYRQYLDDFDTLETKLHSDFKSEPNVQSALKLCYTSRTDTSVFKYVRGKIFLSQPDHLKLVCPYCLIEGPKTIDHYIGQSAFPEFCTLVRNLIPSCNTCNLKKKEHWRKNKKRRFIHFYNDTFLNQQFLYGRLVYPRGSSTPRIELYLRKPIGMSDDDFRIVRTHFKDLELISKYIPRATSIISSESQIFSKSIARGVSKVEILNQINDRYLEDRSSLGVNYFKAVVYQTMANTQRYINSL